MAVSKIIQRRPSGLAVFVATAALLISLTFFAPDRSIVNTQHSGSNPDHGHPIASLINDAEQRFESLVQDESRTLTEATQKYRARRGRHPPPGFDAWWSLAKEKDVIVIESLFDQIYTDLEPFWGKEPSTVRSFAEQWPHTISIRQGDTTHNVRSRPHHWLGKWSQMLQEIPYLPDVDLAFGVEDEPFSIVPFHLVNMYMEDAERRRREHNALTPEQIRSDFPTYGPLLGDAPEAEPDLNRTAVAPRVYWDFVVDACRPTDPIFTQPERVPSSWFPPKFSTDYTTGSLRGYVQNFTTAKNVCHNPNLRTLHGNMILPARDHIYTDLHPIFVVAKLSSIGTDILAPIPTNWYESSEKGNVYGGSAQTFPWEDKKNVALWRGSATGGQHQEGNWYGFQRHRLVAMMNATAIDLVEEETARVRDTSHDDPTYEDLEAAMPGQNFDWGLHTIAFPSRRLFDISAQAYGKLASWASEIVDGAFTHFHCFPFGFMFQPGDCLYMASYYEVAPLMDTSEILGYKYLPDADGQSSSGRFRGYLESLSVPIKASVFAEWHDSRLVPWHHFVPMSNEFQEWWGLLQYFFGYQSTGINEETVAANDDVGRKIGQQGSDWTRRTLRNEDMVLYLYRLVLEYARICADDRVYLGYVDDLSGIVSDGSENFD